MSKPHAVSVSRFEATFREVALPFGLTLDAVKISGECGRVQSHPFEIELEQPGRILVTVGEDRLRQFLEEKSPGGLYDFEVKIEGGKLNVSATAKMIMEIRAGTVCNLEVREGTELWVVLEEVHVLGVGAKGLVERQLEKVNPIVDLKELPVDVLLEKVNLTEGELIAVGSLAIS